MRGERHRVHRHVRARRAARVAQHLAPTASAAREPQDYLVAIVGGGFGGIIQAVRLLRAGLPPASLAIFEKGTDFGGTWHWNRYPGAACDVPSLAYLPLDLLDPTYTPLRKFSTQPEIEAFARRAAALHGLYARTTFGAEVTDLTFVEADRCWAIRAKRTSGAAGLSARARFVVCASGPLSTPNLPHIPGLDAFERSGGLVMHTAQWDPSAARLLGGDTIKAVGVVGTGATAVQLIPKLAAQGGVSLKVFQRTPAFCIPKNDEEFGEDTASEVAAARGELARQERESFNSVTDDVFFPLFQDAAQSRGFADKLIAALHHAVRDPGVAEALTPRYALGCKRMILSDDYWPCFNRPNVELVAVGSAGLRMNGAGAVVPGPGLRECSTIDLDALILATGFDNATGFFGRMTIRGRGGRRLVEDVWASNPSGLPSTLYGIHSRGFPNLFLLAGPQGFSPITNAMQVLEDQSAWVCGVISEARAQGESVLVEPTQGAQDAWVARCRAAGRASVYSQCSNWYNGEGGDVIPYAGRWRDYLDAQRKGGLTVLHFDRSER